MWTCPKCKKVKNPTKHHWLPRRHYGNTKHYVLLCRDCHDEIEKITPFEKVDHQTYLEIVTSFLGGEYANLFTL